MTKINYKKITAFVISLGVFIIPLFILHAAQGDIVTTIQNPLGPNSTSFVDLLSRIMTLVSQVGAIIVVFFIIYSGYKFVTAGSSDTDRTKAKDIFYATIIGGAILLGAAVIANVVVHTVNCTIGRAGTTGC